MSPKSFEIKIKENAYRIIRSNLKENMYSVFNHTTCHIIKNDNGTWKAVEHKFGMEHLPVDVIGEMIDTYLMQFPPEPLSGTA